MLLSLCYSSFNRENFLCGEVRLSIRKKNLRNKKLPMSGAKKHLARRAAARRTIKSPIRLGTIDPDLIELAVKAVSSAREK